MAHRSYFISLRSIRVSSFQHLRQVPAGGQAAGSKGPTARHPPAAAAPRSAPSMVQKGRPDAPPEGSAETPNRPAAAIRKRNAARRPEQNRTAAPPSWAGGYGPAGWRRPPPGKKQEVEHGGKQQHQRQQCKQVGQRPLPGIEIPVQGRRTAACPAGTGRTPAAPRLRSMPAQAQDARPASVRAAAAARRKSAPASPASGKKRIRLTAGPAASAAIWAVTAAPSSSVQTAAIASCQSVSPPASGSRRSRQDSTPSVRQAA